jgi:hypothetical protein
LVYLRNQIKWMKKHNAKTQRRNDAKIDRPRTERNLSASSRLCASALCCFWADYRADLHPGGARLTEPAVLAKIAVEAKDSNVILAARKRLAAIRKGSK